ncbi:MAG: prolyl oligopeptidase family serine peptidase [Bacteroidales bacterium]
MKKKLFIIPIIPALAGLALLTSLFFFSLSIKQEVHSANKLNAKQIIDTSNGKLPLNDTTLIINNHKVFLKIQRQNKKGTFLVLHGWNFPAEDWCNKTSLCNKVLEKGYCVVLPDMGKSVYHEKNYPETRAEWRTYPTRKWLSDTLIPILQKKYSLLLKKESNYIVGLSTGARGVALVLLDFPELFKGAAALSGDYAQEKMPADNLMTGFYGPFEKFKERWLKQDNPISRIKEYKTPIYLAHGMLDQVVPPEQTIMFYDSLKKYHPDLKIKLNMPNARHDYLFWNSEVDNILKFFEIMQQ